MNNNSVDIMIELENILKTNSLLTKVEAGLRVEPIAQEVEEAAAYITFTNSVPQGVRQLEGIDGYDFHGFFTITCNVDSTHEKYKLYNICDSIQRSILSDNPIWDKLVNRDIITVEYDNAEFFPKRTATIVIEVVYRLTCV